MEKVGGVDLVIKIPELGKGYNQLGVVETFLNFRMVKRFGEEGGGSRSTLITLLFYVGVILAMQANLNKGNLVEKAYCSVFCDEYSICDEHRTAFLRTPCDYFSKQL